VPALPGTLVPLDQQLPPLGKYLLGTAIALDTLSTGRVPDIDPKTATGRQAREYMAERQARIWPGLVTPQGTAR
jgi:hypothetical protein